MVELMLLTIVLAWSLTCTEVKRYRDQGVSDQQMESWAREHHVPEPVIHWAKVHCQGR